MFFYQKVKKTAYFVYLSNLFLFLISLVLNLESSFRLGLPLNSISYYVFISSAVLIFYLFSCCYQKDLIDYKSIRVQFYIKNRLNLKIIKSLLWLMLVISLIFLLKELLTSKGNINLVDCIILSTSFCFILFYYDWQYSFSLRRIFWLKPFIIGFSWVIATVFLPLFILSINYDIDFKSNINFYYLFIQTFLYCTINAIIFDLKDYSEDSSKNLTTFVVKYGYYRTLNFIVYPLLLVLILTILFFLNYDTSFSHTNVDLLPSIGFLFLIIGLNKERSIMYYLVLIDGIILLKALVGILNACLK